MTEIELSVLQEQCLKRRIGDAQTLEKEIAAIEQQRNQEMAQLVWRFITEDARIKLGLPLSSTQHFSLDRLVGSIA